MLPPLVVANTVVWLVTEIGTAISRQRNTTTVADLGHSSFFPGLPGQRDLNLFDSLVVNRHDMLLYLLVMIGIFVDKG